MWNPEFEACALLSGTELIDLMAPLGTPLYLTAEKSWEETPWQPIILSPRKGNLNGYMPALGVIISNVMEMKRRQRRGSSPPCVFFSSNIIGSGKTIQPRQSNNVFIKSLKPCEPIKIHSWKMLYPSEFTLVIHCPAGNPPVARVKFSRNVLSGFCLKGKENR